MEINSEGTDPILISIAGEVDLATAPELEQALGAALSRPGTTRVQVDLSRVGFMDSAGLRALIAARRQAEDGKQAVVLYRPSEQVRRVIEITGLSEAFGLEMEDGQRPSGHDG